MSRSPTPAPSATPRCKRMLSFAISAGHSSDLGAGAVAVILTKDGRHAIRFTGRGPMKRGGGMDEARPNK